MELEKYDIIVVGCGLSGVVIAERFSSLQNKKILIIDKRDHIGGNCYDYYDNETGILMSKYGPHSFHTNDEEVFRYINKFSKWNKWELRTLGLIDKKYLPVPANITTVNKVFNLDIKTSEEMDQWLSDNQVKYENITNGEEMAKSRVGEVLYEKIFKHYTFKQWNKYPADLAPEVLARIPIRNSFDDRYFSDKYQVLPEKGYTAFFQSILDQHKHNIDVKLNVDFFDIKDQITKDQIIIYTGPIDTYFGDKGLPKLEYRSLDFHIERKMNTDFYQPSGIVNHPSADKPYTRCVEYKHFLNQKSDHTVFVKETSTDVGEPYYPVLNDRNKELYAKYQKMAEEEENIHFVGRLASYKYFNMDQAIKNSLDYYREHFKCSNEIKKTELNSEIIDFSQCNHKIVIGRYNENVEWTREFQNVIIYNKGEKLGNNYNEVFLNNVGRESHTYYKYICDNYENLADYTIFLQGMPFDHSPNIISNLHKYINNNQLNIDFEFLSEEIHYSSLGLERRRYPECRNIYKTWKLIFGVNPRRRQRCIFGAGAQFIVSKKKILENTREFYENIVRILEYHINPTEAYDVERLHKYILRSS